MKTKLNLTIGTLLLAVSNLYAATHYVSPGSTSPTPPYTNWVTAATNIQDAVDVAVVGDEIVVTNGIYATGGRTAGTDLVVNRVAVDKPLMVRSVNGPQFTVIRGWQVPGPYSGCGDGAIRCVYLTSGASLCGFTLTHGATGIVGYYEYELSGGGLWCESSAATVSDCVITGNAARYRGGGARSGTLEKCTVNDNAASQGGGVYYGMLNNCVVTGNSAWEAGGGAVSAVLNNCTLTGNSAWGNAVWDGGGGAAYCTLNNCTLTGNSARRDGGGAYGGTLTNCILYYNTATNSGPNYHGGYNGGTLDHCCTTPLSDTGTGNITNEPAFVDAAAGNFRLRPDSACIDAGTDLSAFITSDLDANPRPSDGNGDGFAAFDIGAYEFVLAPEDALQRLIGVLDDSGLAHPRPLEATLQAALAAIQRGNSTAAINQLHAFQNKVRAQVAPSYPALAASFIQAAQRVIDVLRGD
jgi:hypothetical protein